MGKAIVATAGRSGATRQLKTVRVPPSRFILPVGWYGSGRRRPQHCRVSLADQVLRRLSRLLRSSTSAVEAVAFLVLASPGGSTPSLPLAPLPPPPPPFPLFSLLSVFLPGQRVCEGSASDQVPPPILCIKFGRIRFFSSVSCRATLSF